jgi:hypothetical protein
MLGSMMSGLDDMFATSTGVRPQSGSALPGRAQREQVVATAARLRRQIERRRLQRVEGGQHRIRTV